MPISTANGLSGLLNPGPGGTCQKEGEIAPILTSVEHIHLGATSQIQNKETAIKELTEVLRIGDSLENIQTQRNFSKGHNGSHRVCSDTGSH